jgi:hypothetical protein
VTTPTDAETHLRQVLAAVAEATPVPEPPGLVADDPATATAPAGASFVAGGRTRPHDGGGGRGRRERTRLRVALGATVAAAVAALALVGPLGGDERPPVHTADGAERSDGTDGEGQEPSPGHDEPMVAIPGSEVRVPAHIDGLGDASLAGGIAFDPPPYVGQGRPPFALYEEPTADGSPQRYLAISVGVDAARYEALVAHRPDAVFGPVSGAGDPTSFRDHDVDGRWVLQVPNSSVVWDDDGGGGAPAATDDWFFASGVSSVVQVVTRGLDADEARELIARIDAPPPLSTFALPCSGMAVVDDLADLAVPGDFVRFPAPGHGGDPTLDASCARHLASSTPGRHVTFVDSLPYTLSNPSLFDFGREVRWGEIEDGFGAVVTPGDGSTFGVEGYGLSAGEWQALMASLSEAAP